MKTSNKRVMVTSVIACLCIQLCIGILYLWSVFRTPVVEYYNWTAAAATMVSSVMMFGFVLGNLFGGIAQIKISSKVVATIGCLVFCSGLILTSLLTRNTVSLMYITYSVISGLGCGFAYGSVLFCVIRWMPHKRGFASGLSASAFGFSTVVFSPVSKWLLGHEAFGANAVPMTFRTLGIVFLVISLAACMFIRLPSDAYIRSLNLPTASASTDSVPPVQAMKKGTFWCVFLACFLLTSLWMILMPLISDLGQEKGLSASLAILTVSLTGISNAAGRLFLASMSDRIGRTRSVQLLGVLTIVAATGIVVFGGALYMLLVLLTAFAYGGVSSVFPALTTDLYGPRYASVNYGVILLSLGISSIIYNTASNFFLSATGGIALSFIICAISGLAAILLMVIVDKRFRRSIKVAACEIAGN